MQVENIDRFWDPSANRNIKGPKGNRMGGRGAHLLLWGSALSLYLYFSSYRTDRSHYKAPPPPCAAPAPYREALSIETTCEQPHLRSLEVETKIPDHVPQVKLPLRDHLLYVKTDARR